MVLERRKAHTKAHAIYEANETVNAVSNEEEKLKYTTLNPYTG